MTPLTLAVVSQNHKKSSLLEALPKLPEPLPISIITESTHFNLRLRRLFSVLSTIVGGTRPGETGSAKDVSVLQTYTSDGVGGGSRASSLLEGHSSETDLQHPGSGGDVSAKRPLWACFATGPYRDATRPACRGSTLHYAAGSGFASPAAWSVTSAMSPSPACAARVRSSSSRR